jgi:hypothetical protein
VSPASVSATRKWMRSVTVANALSVGNVAASHRLHYCADRDMHLPEVLGWTATEGMGPWC